MLEKEEVKGEKNPKIQSIKFLLNML